MRELAKPPIRALRTFAGSAPALAAKSSASPTASMVSATTIWLATFVVCPSPLPPTSVMFLPHQLKERLYLLERRWRAADHDRQRGRLGANFAARDRSVQIFTAQLVDAAGELLAGQRRYRAHIDDDFAARQPLGDAAWVEQDALDIRRVRNHRDDDLGLGGNFLAGGARERTRIEQFLRKDCNVIEEERMPGFQ
jgi:hypothetical protein